MGCLRLFRLLRLFAAVSSACLVVGAAAAQATVSAVMLSDVHFDPFRDPAKVAQLRAEPVEHWAAILDAPASATQAVDLAALQAGCHARAADSDWALMKQTLASAHAEQARPGFVTLSGDLLTHEFTCRFQRLTPGASAQDVAGFAAKTVAFVMAQVRQAFPHVPVYGALGNNDSGCADYRETPGDAFLKGSAEALAAAAGSSAASFTPEGDYSVPLPAPMEHVRLIVLEDIFEARQFNTCAAGADRSPEKAQMDWLRAQLAEARAHGEHVWVMAHIPPGVDVYTSFRHYVLQPGELCSAEPKAFLADTTFADALLDYADVVRLALLGHTHMDEIRVLHRGEATIPVKIVPAVSPYIGNHPAFLVATVDARSAVLKDWRTIVSPGSEGSAAPWTEAYRFATAYHLPDFSGASALKLAEAFTADKTGQGAESAVFRQHFYPGDIGIYALGLGQIWPAYACSVREDRPSAVQKCVCGVVPKKGDAP